MNIVICGSMTTAKEMLTTADILTFHGHAVMLPEFTHEHAALHPLKYTQKETADDKQKNDLILKHYNKIKSSDAILVVNIDRKTIPGYIGGSSFLEMGFAFVLNKKIFLLNPVPEMLYSDEITAMRPIVLDNDVSKIA